MNTMKTAVIVMTLLSGTSWGSTSKEASPKSAVRPAPLVDLRALELSPKTADVIRLAEKECQCSKWEITYEETCVAYDSNGNCVKKETVRRRRCIEWDHCHDKA